MEKFSAIEYRRPDVKALMEKLVEMTTQFSQAETAAEQERIIHDISTMEADFYTMMVLASVRNSVDSADMFYETEKNFFDANSPLVRDLEMQFYRVMIESRFRDELQKSLGQQLFRVAKLRSLISSPQVIPALQQENELISQYYQVTALGEVDFEGSKYNLSAIEALEVNTDRNLRKRVAKAKYQWYADNEPALDGIFDKLVKLRTSTAQTLGFKDFTGLGYARMERVDYGPEEVAAFRKSILENVVPLTVTMRERQRQRLGVDKLKYYDVINFFQSGNAKPKGPPEWIIANGEKMYTELSPETKEFFDFMSNNELMDLVNKKNKQPGGYCTWLANQKAPFIFSNFNGTSSDITVLTHEAGHAFQHYQSRNIRLEEYKFSSQDISEIHSQAMEYFTWPWMELFFKEDATKFKYFHISDAVFFFAFCAAIDEFQHVVYGNPDMSSAERDAAWIAIDKKYRPYTDYDGLEFLEKGGAWKRIPHLFTSPFYFIDYGLALLGALQYWHRQQQGDTTAWNDYLALCRAGGSGSFRQLLKVGNLKDPFDTATLQPIIAAITAWLNNVDETQLQ